MPVFQIQHTTQYEYDYPVWESVNCIKLYPRTDDGQEILRHEIRLSDPDALIHTYTDYFGNTVGMFNQLGNHQKLVIDSLLTVRTPENRPETAPGYGEDWEALHQAKSTQMLLLDLARPEAFSEKGQLLYDACFPHSMPPLAAVMRSMEYIYAHFQYIKGITDVETTLEEVLSHGSGVCQDFAHVQLYLLRTMGIPSRYVSGYICPNTNGMRGEGATHAWVEAWLPGMGWVGTDPTNNILVTDHHVKLAVGRDFSDCTPVKGIFKGSASHSLSVYVSVGYEDGHIFSDQNALKMHKLQSNILPVDYTQQQ